MARQLHECEMLASDYLGRVRGTHALYRLRVRQMSVRIRTCVILRTREIFMHQCMSALCGTHYKY